MSRVEFTVSSAECRIGMPHSALDILHSTLDILLPHSLNTFGQNFVNALPRRVAFEVVEVRFDGLVVATACWPRLDERRVGALECLAECFANEGFE